MLRFSFRTKGKREIARGWKPLLPQWASFDPVFDTVDRIENDYHRFVQRKAERNW